MTFRTLTLTGASFLAMLFLGIGVAIIGAAAPSIGLDTGRIAVLQGVQNIGFAVAVVFFGSLADVRPKTVLLSIGSLVIGVGFGFFYLVDSFVVNLFLMSLIGVGIGNFEAVTDALVFELHPRRRSAAISLNHFFVTIGSLSITLYVLFLQLNWRQSVVQAAAAVLVLSIVFFVAGATDVRSKTPRRTPVSFRAVVGDRRIASMFLLMMCAYGIQISTIGIVPVFLIEYRGFSPTAATGALALFVAGIATGRVFVGYITRERHIVRNMRVLFAGATLGVTLFYFVHLGEVVFAILFFSGLMVSSLLPLIITFAGLAFPDSAGSSMGAVKVGIPAGGIAVPFLMAFSQRFFGPAVSFLVPPAAGLAALILISIARPKLIGESAAGRAAAAQRGESP